MEPDGRQAPPRSSTPGDIELNYRAERDGGRGRGPRPPMSCRQTSAWPAPARAAAGSSSQGPAGIHRPLSLRYGYQRPSRP